MSSLKDLIPAQYYVKPVVAQDITDGKIDVLPNGKVVVFWERRSKCFNDNLAAARELKSKGYGNYRPNCYDWMFHRNAAQLVDQTFPDTLFRTPEFVNLAKAEDGKTIVDHTPVTTVTPKKHGKVKLHNGQFIVQWGGQAGFCSKDDFQKYLTTAQKLKQAFPGSNGWNREQCGWSFKREAAATIIRKFPAETFEHCSELAADAAKYPEKNDQPACPPNAHTVKLLETADQVFETFA